MVQRIVTIAHSLGACTTLVIAPMALTLQFDAFFVVTDALQIKRLPKNFDKTFFLARLMLYRVQTQSEPGCYGNRDDAGHADKQLGGLPERASRKKLCRNGGAPHK